MSIVNQVVHINPKVLFQTSGKYSSRFLNQIASTVDFGPSNNFLTWITGGLNMQVTHHLFPHVSHVHFPVIQPIVKSFCQKNGIQYNEYPTFFSAIKAHFEQLKTMSMP